MTVIAGWLTNRGDPAGGQTRAQTRMLPLGTMWPAGEMTSRPGIIPGGDPMAVSGSGMTVTVGLGRAIVQGSAAAGVYPVAVTVPEGVAVSNGDASNARRDIVGIRVYDSLVDGSGLYLAQVEILEGTPAPSPVDPTPPVGAVWLPLARLRIPAGASAGSPPSWGSVIDDLRTYTVGLGGVLPDPASTAAGVYVDQVCMRDGLLHRWTGSAWVPVQPEEPPMVKLLAAAVPLSAGVYTAIPWQTVVARNSSGAGMWSAGQPTRIVAPEPGTYAVTGWLNWPGALGINDARVHITNQSAADVIKGASMRGSTGNMSSTVAGTWTATAAGQYIQVTANTSGLTLNEANVGVWKISSAVAA